MPIPRLIARFNRWATNPLLGQLAGRVPPFALVIHQGRRSGRVYRTPVLAFPTGAAVLIALTYGPDADWVRNALAAGACQVLLAGRGVVRARPRLVEGVAPPASLPAPIWLALRLLRVRAFLWLTPETGRPPG